MTVAIGSTRATELATAEQTNNPVILWNNIATTGNTSSPNGVNTDGAVANCLNGATYDACRPVITSTIAPLVVTGSGLTANCAAIAAHNIGTLGLSVRVQYSDNGGSTWTDAGAGAVTPTDDQAIMWRFDESSHDDWRLVVFNGTSEEPAIGVFVLGVELVMPETVYQGYRPPITPTAVTTQSNVSEGGHLLGSAVVRRGSNAAVDFQHLEASFVRGTDYKPFQSHFNDGNGFFFAWRPTKYGDCHFAWREGDPIVPENTGPEDRMGLSMNMRLYDE
jgi:hypothetical protein